jgi:uncharacterized glyoxalase superfamily protein PhnB
VAALAFYKAAFGAREIVRLAGDNGRLAHAAVEINGGTVMMVDENPEWGIVSPKTLGRTTLTLHQVVEDAQAVFDRAVAAGATPVLEPREMFWGDLYGIVSDPFGYAWSIGQPQHPGLSQDDITAAMKAM